MNAEGAIKFNIDVLKSWHAKLSPLYGIVYQF